MATIAPPCTQYEIGDFDNLFSIGANVSNDPLKILDVLEQHQSDVLTGRSNGAQKKIKWV
jgi:hypothetical protein